MSLWLEGMTMPYTTLTVLPLVVVVSGVDGCCLCITGHRRSLPRIIYAGTCKYSLRSFDAMVAEQHHSSAGLSAPTSDVEASLRRDAQRWIAAGGRELWRCEKAQGLQLRHVTVAKPLTRRSCASTVWTCGLL